MKKHVFLLIVLILPLVVGAQSRDIQISWKYAVPSATPIEQSRGLQQGEEDATSDILRLELGPLAPVYTTQWEDSRLVDPNSIQVTNVRYGSLTAAKLNEIDQRLVPDQLEYSIASTEAREKRYTVFHLSPVVRQNGRLQKVLSFSVNYRYGSTSQRVDPPAITNSVLAQGQWFKFKVENTGIHKIDKSFLNQLGINSDNINPQNIKIYGHGGKSLPLLNALNTTYDLPEIAIQVVGEEDGRFDNSDHILFYATNTEGYVNDNDSHLNPYSDDSYYYITTSGGRGKRVQNMVEPSGAIEHTITQFDDYQFHEKDEENPTKLGRVW